MGNSASANGFSAKSTCEDVIRDIDLTGKNIIITGANSGIGFEATKIMAKHGANIIMACRDLNRSKDAFEEVQRVARFPENVRLLKLDLGSFESILNFVNEFNQMNIPLHVLMNNAGVITLSREETVDGLERVFGTNHIGHFLLTNKLVPRLLEGKPSRVVNLSSDAHKFGKLDWEDLESKKSFSTMRVYGKSKTCNILFTLEFNKRYSEQGIYSNAVHPGYVPSTNLGDVRSRAPAFVVNTYLFIGNMIGRSLSQGAATQVYCATAPELEGKGGAYFYDANEKPADPHAQSLESAEKLWNISYSLCQSIYQQKGLPFDDFVKSPDTQHDDQQNQAQENLVIEN
eukprot:TRINITY_DN3623_c0_g1_i1.p1 TRINITY_DN3623_c0_g1~~TRINITY_DN3623_c0_g1_i1.p1  ORF type:complete len:344 (-),score=57.93 TRINITY_DN3623_c0_g1_i1:68-1099(-)